ncbi:MAG: outer membrane protein assembly factor [Ketobacter sp.]|uniref:autotransporter assembly complex protein TamA n=1 Tax=Ketobacter sp. MCCC 1A13808 TaxID=2602738 RepID=UPI002107C931|nr:outer membrane protein assembly factor [Ketobacter sp. MCCC 1A13808]
MYHLPCQAQIKLKINGVDDTLKENIRLHLSGWEKIPPGSPAAAAKSIRAAVNKSMQPLGYYQANIDPVIDGNQLTLNIDPGPPMLWEQSDIVIPPLPADVQERIQPWRTSDLLKTGSVLNHQNYDEFKKGVVTAVRQVGYLDAKWEQSRLLIDVARQRARAVLHLASGERYKIKSITFNGSDLSEKTTNTLIDTQPGAWYDADDIGLVYDNLLGSGYFKYANIDVEQEAPDQATLDIELTDHPSDQFTTGIGYGTDTGARGKLGWTRTMVDPRGDSIFSNLQVSEIGEELSTQYRIPWPHPLERYLSWDTGWRREITTDRESSLFSTGLSFNRSSRKRWQYKFGLNLEHEKYRQGNSDDQIVTYILPNYQYLQRHVLGEKSGHRSLIKVWFNTALGISILDDQSRFFSVESGVSYDVELSYRHGFATRVDLGGIATDDFYTVPLSKRFYTGGDQTVRGYKYNAISSEDPDGELLGGQFLNVFSMEYRYRYLPEWMAAVFVDTGRAYISGDEPFYKSAGIGLRWQLPVGMIAFDLAQPIGDPDENKVRLHVYMSATL